MKLSKLTQQALLEYESLLHKHKVSIDTYDRLKDKRSAVDLQNSVVELIRFVFEDILKWTPYQIENHISYGLLDKLSLAIIFDNYIIYPNEIDKGARQRNRTSPHLCDMSYLLHLLYPSIFSYRYVDAVIRTYKRIEKMKAKNIISKWVYPAKMFTDDKGSERAILCFRYVLKHSEIKTLPINKMYELFADTLKAERFLAKKGISEPCKILFDSPLDYFHASLPPKYQNLNLYEKYSELACAEKNKA